MMTSIALENIQSQLKKKSSKKTAIQSAKFFKTKKGEYSYGDIFMGVRVPDIRSIAKNNINLSRRNTQKLIKSKYHEERMLGLFILVNQYAKTDNKEQREKIYQCYIAHFKYINNWDLVDVTAPHIVGQHLLDKDRSVLYTWAKSNDLWTKRISIIANWWLIRKGDLTEIFKIAEILLHDEHDLIHKAVGWMLREAAKQDLIVMQKFLNKYYQEMPRTMLRYAIEKFPEDLRQKYLKGKI